MVCGNAFALRLRSGENLVRRDPQIDFVTYFVNGPNGSFVIYEGNASQPADDEIQTGLDWPSEIAVHDNRGAAAKAEGTIPARLLLAERHTQTCARRAG